MRKRGVSVLEVLYPSGTKELVRSAKAWVASSSDVMVSFVWRAYDALLANPELRPALAMATDDVERGITRLLFFALDDLLSGDEPFRLLPEAPEDESRKHAPARPRAYDIAFAMRANPRIMWSLEAKVLRTPATLADYVSTLTDRFLSGDYAPFVAEGAMAGYLLHGTSDEAFDRIARQLKTRLVRPARLRAREHRISAHARRIPRGMPYPARFRCHHLMMAFS